MARGNHINKTKKIAINSSIPSISSRLLQKMDRCYMLIFLFLVVANRSTCFVVLGSGGSGNGQANFLSRLHTKIRKASKLCMKEEDNDNIRVISTNITSTSSSFDNLGRRERKRVIARQQRINSWLAKYGSSDALQQTFGKYATNQKLSPTQTRALYHTLLPRSLLALSELDILDPSDLAPLAYQARIAAKEYARSRCNTSTGQALLTMLNPELRKKYNQPSMTWDDIYTKYETQIMEEERAKADAEGRKTDDEDILMQIYMRIIEKSCATNAAFDGLFLNDDNVDDDGEDELRQISNQLESDIQSILLDKKENKQLIKSIKKDEKEKKKSEKQRIKSIKKFDKLKRKLEKRRRRQHEHDVDEDDLI